MDELTRTKPDRPTRRTCEIATTTNEPKDVAIRTTKPREQDCLRHCATPENTKTWPTRQRPARIPITPHSIASHRIAPHCAALYRTPRHRQRANGAGIEQVFPRGLLQPRALGAPEEPAKSRDTAGIASWRWTSATQPVRGFAICPAILGLAWLAPRWGFARPLSACHHRQSQP